jgi:hypothetical protein
MFCPKCKAEYREGFSRCASCDLDLVPNLPAEPEPSETHAAYLDLTRVKTYWNRHEAELEKSYLSANGINAVICGDDCGGTRPALSFARGVHLLVKNDDVEKAKNILNDDDDANPNEENLGRNRKPVTPLLSKILTWSFIVCLVSLIGIIIAWTVRPEGRGLTSLTVILISLRTVAEVAFLITIGVIAHRLGRRWIVWAGFSFALGPIGLVVAYLIMNGYIKEARNRQRKEKTC